MHIFPILSSPQQSFLILGKFIEPKRSSGYSGRGQITLSAFSIHTASQIGRGQFSPLDLPDPPGY